MSFTDKKKLSSPYKKQKRRWRNNQKKRHEDMQKVAKERINFLISSADEIISTNQDLANRYIEIARKIAMGAKITIPLEQKRKICHGCKKLLIPGNTMHFRLNRRKNYATYLSVTCHMCGHITRYLVKGKLYEKNQTKTKG